MLVHGLGEFYFLNEIDCSDPALVEFQVRSDRSPKRVASQNARKKQIPLVLVGGGKDSALSLELLKYSENESRCFALNPHPSFYRTIETAGYQKENVLEAQRSIDPTLLELNARGYLNGHTPFSAYLAFLSTLVAEIHACSHVLASK